MWETVAPPSQLTLVHGRPSHLRGFFQELAHEAVHGGTGDVLWCDGDHGFNPYDFAELNLTRGHSAEDGAERLLVKRCMTPFQWDSVLTQHLPQKLASVEARLVLVLPFDSLFSTDEIRDWEAEDFVRSSLRHLARAAKAHAVPIVLGIDMARWWKTHPVLAQSTAAATDKRWTVEHPAGRWRLLGDDGQTLDPSLRKARTLVDYLSPEQLEQEARPVVPVELPRPLPAPKPKAWRHR